jgi:Zn-dependent M28 family amino/carboxypeptidase
MRRGMSKAKYAIALALALMMALGAVGVASAAVPSDSTQLRDAVTVDGILQHERAFQEIADANGGTRASGTPGYTASADYVAGKLKDAGYLVTRQKFDYEAFTENSDPILDPIEPDLDPYTPGDTAEDDFSTMNYSGSGDVTAPLQAVGGIIIPSPGGSASGCSAEDFDGFVEGNIALIQRGTCDFRVKVENAEEAGAAGVVIFNEGNVIPDDDRVGNLFGTLDPPQVDIPVVGTSFEVGQELYNLLQEGQVILRLAVDATVEPRTTENVIADTPTGRQDRTVVVGSHLDSVQEGPGINDNGSGSATDLEVALQMAKLDIQPRNRVRFAFWGAEESGLVGSQYYVDSLTKRQIKDIAVNLNFDMVASRNYVRFVYDGDASDTDSLGSTGSGVVEDVFTDYFDSRGLASEPTAFDGRSDYDAFISVGIPAGGIFTGAEDKKTPAEAAIYGGVPGVAYDPCYHQACDSLDPIGGGADAQTYTALNAAYDGALEVDSNISNLNTQALDEMSDAVAHGTVTFAETTSAVNGRGKGSGAAKSSANKYHGSLLQR